jgi:hypothetical protein
MTQPIRRLTGWPLEARSRGLLPVDGYQQMLQVFHRYFAHTEETSTRASS